MWMSIFPCPLSCLPHSLILQVIFTDIIRGIRVHNHAFPATVRVRRCGGMFCGVCSRHKRSMPHLGYKHAVRVCDACALAEDSRRHSARFVCETVYH